MIGLMLRYWEMQLLNMPRITSKVCHCGQQLCLIAELATQRLMADLRLSRMATNTMEAEAATAGSIFQVILARRDLLHFYLLIEPNHSGESQSQFEVILLDPY